MRILAFPLFVSLCAVPVWAQSTFGTLVGSVQDKSGAAIPEVAIQVKNLEENTTRETLSNEQGQYQLANLKPGRYEITASKPGFATYKLSGTALDARQTLRADVLLEVATVSETVQVEAQVTAVNTENGTISDSKTFEQVTQLPVNYRGGSTSPLAAILTVPGVQQDNAGNYSIGGGLPAMIEFTVDGVSTVNIRSNGALQDMYPSSELIREFKVTAVNNNAEFAQVGDVTVSTKSGANQVHGSLFEYHQNRALDATTYGSRTKQAKVFNTFGGSVGGVIRIPKLYNGRDRSFFFVAYEGNRRPGSTLQQFNVPTDAMRNGNLSTVPGGAAADPTTLAPFPGNVIPASRINAVSRRLLSSNFPAQNFGGPDTVLANYRTLVSTPSRTNGFDMRVDHSLSTKQQIYGRYSYKTLNSATANDLLPADITGQTNRNLIISHNYTLKSNVFNEFRFGISHWARDVQFPINGTQALRDLGITGLDVSNHPQTGAFPRMDFSEGTGFTVVGRGKDGARKSVTYQFTDNLSWLRGRHAFKFGFDIRPMKYVDVQTFGGSDDFGSFTFSRGAFSGNAFADLLLGLPTTTYYSVTGPDLDSPVSHYRFYAQDEFRVSNKLTLSYGLRWQFHPPFTEVNGNITNFDPVTNTVIIPDGALKPAKGFLEGFNACPGTVPGLPCSRVVSAGEFGIGKGLRNRYYNNFAPRFSIAYRPFSDNRTVLRGGFGLFTMTALGPLAYALTGIHTADTRTYQNFRGRGQAPLYTFPQAFGGDTNTTAAGSAEFIVGTEIDYRDPTSAQWNLTVERELGGSNSIRVSYIGMNSFRLNSTVDHNTVAPSSTPYSRARLPFPNWSRILSRGNFAFSNYQSGQVEFNRRMSKGLFLQSSYTWAKNLGNVNGDVPTAFAAESGATLGDRFNTRNIRGNIVGTRRHRMLITGMYQLPFGKGRPFLNTMPTIGNAVIGGWELSTVTMLQSGPWLTPTMARTADQSNINVVGRGINVRPDRLGDGKIGNPSPAGWWDLSAFTLPAAGVGRVGNAGVGILEGPGTVAVAMGLAKNFYVTEKVRFRLEGTFTNVPNRPNFAPPATNISTPVTFGRAVAVQSSENSGNRVGQVALRLDF